MLVLLNTETIKKLDISFLDYAILKIIYASETKKSSCFISQEKLAQYLGVTRQTIYKRLKELEKKDYLRKDFQFKRVTLNVKKIFLNERQAFKVVREKHKIKEIETRQEKNSDMLELFNAVYSKIKRR